MKVVTDNIIKYDTVYNGIEYKYALFTVEITVFGNLNKQSKANGKWVYIDKEGYCILSGKCKNGYKIKTWKSDKSTKWNYEKIKYFKTGEYKSKTRTVCL